MKQIGIRQEMTEEILNMFRPAEGQVSIYYGKIRNGKTYAATADILDLLRRGEVVFANWMVDVPVYDERDHFWTVFWKILLRKRTFFRYNCPDNFHYFHPDEIDIPFLGRLVNVHVFIDEGQWIFNSHTKDHDPEKRKLILHNGHYCRALNIITQRPQNVFKDMRSQVHVWYKCEKLLSFPWLLFRRSEIQDMVEDLPDEESIQSVKVYFASKSVFNAYNTHGMRAANAILATPDFEAYNVGLWGKLKRLMWLAVPFRRRVSANGGQPMT